MTKQKTENPLHIAILLLFSLAVAVGQVQAAVVNGFMGIDPGVRSPQEVAPDIIVDVYQGGSYFALGSNSPNGNSTVMLEPGPAGGILLGSYQNFVLDPDIPAYDPDGPDGPSLPGTGYGSTPVVESDILMPFQFFGNWTYVGTNPVSYQTGNSKSAPTVDVDLSGNLTADMSSWEVMWNGIAFEQGPRTGTVDAPIPGVATGTYDALTGRYTLDWAALIVGGPFSGVMGYWHLEGVISPVPVPAAVWLFGSGLLGLLGAAARRRTA